MSDTDLTNQLATFLAQMQAANLTATPSLATSGWSKPASTVAPMEIMGVSIPISLETQHGKIRVYLNFPGIAASSPQALLGLIDQIAEMGLPLETWQSRPNNSGSSWGGNSNGGFNRGYNSNRSGNWRR